jgi:pyruvate dehydrogenase E1 component alpha subunit
MQLIRRFEERSAEMYQRAKIGGYCHLNLGEEATVVGLMSAMQPRDYLFTTYREHGYAIARGIEPGRVMAELFGRTTGVSKGWGGSMHLFDVDARLLGGYGIVGGQIPPATGAALAITYRGPGGPETEAVVCQLGDATTNIGAWHESLNLAAIWKLPIVYVVINNRLGMGTPVEKAAGEPDLYKRGCAYRIPGVRVDGNDVIACREAMTEALRMAREDRQPSILEATSWRLRGHSVVDPAKYRSKEEVRRLQDLDPVAAYRKSLIDAGVADAAELAALDNDVEAQVNAVVEFADNSPHPTPDQLFAHAYATPVVNAPRELPGDPLLSA